MKKTLKISIFSIALGAIAGIILNNTYKEKLSNSFLNEEKTYYFIQEGVYSSTSSMQENTKDLLVKTVDSKNDKQYVYLGITRDEKNAQKLKEIYENKGYQIYIKEQNLSNEEFYNNVTQFDILINSTNKESEILTIEEVVLANYEELIKRKSN
ncbi:MAG: hypothetical protein MR846_00940 [Tenericutes bacterium]|nr:hypothetical protein [Mycoplasmatota bacterium]MDD6942279.1 hypothetical protein [bacterium]MDY2697578.1 hypothetical protein [Bacilli bacterium]